MGINSEEFIRDRQKQELIIRENDNYEAKLWFVYYQEEKHKTEILRKEIARLERKLEEKNK